MIHYLKIKPEYLERIREKQKSFEVRFNDRDYQIGDTIWFTEIEEEEKGNEDKSIMEKITLADIGYVLHYPEALKEGWVILGLTKVRNINRKRV